MTRSLTRRQFLRRSTAGFIAASTGMSAFMNPLSVLAQTGGNDFKALVYIFLAGGNDSFNMIAPKDTGALRNRYDDGRRNVAISRADLVAMDLRSPASVFGGSTFSGFGMHPMCGDLARIFNDGEMAVMCNVGNLFEPTDRQQYINQSVTLPPQLFSHADQQRQFQSEPTLSFQFGWGGRVAELLMGSNTDPNVSPLISVNGLNPFQVSQNAELNTFAMSNTGRVTLRGFNGDRGDMVETVMAMPVDHLMGQKYRDIYQSAQAASAVIDNAFSFAEANSVDYDSIFDSYGAGETNFGRQLKTVAKMIAGRQSYTNSRPVFYVRIGGFDTHQNILTDHQDLMATLNNGLAAFRDALTEQDDFDRTLSLVGSEFARTFSPNGDDAGAGTDHAWGGHALMMGGMVDGGRFYGTHPDLIISGDLDTNENRGRGRWIPTTSTSQYAAVAADWFGVSRNNLTSVFPSLNNFSDPFSSDSGLNFIRTGGQA